MERKTLWESYDEAQLHDMNEIAERYKICLDLGKTERECVDLAKDMAEKHGYVSIESCLKENKKLQAGDKVYAIYNNKAVVLYHIGKDSIENGMNILGAHIDSPRLDIKQNPLYEKEGFAYLDTHYYGGIKKYQWVTIPLALHGVIVKMDGTTVKVNIGEDDNDPVFTVTDLLIHLAGNQMSKKANVVIEGESLDLLVGSQTLNDVEKDNVKANVLRLLKEKYDVEEEDFLSAELELVPADKARDLGFDRSMILAYGQDDKVCAYTSLVAMLEKDEVKRTACLLLVDKEEIGSVGATGMRSRFFENVLCELLDRMGQGSDLVLRRVLANSKMLSSDVNAAFDPLYAEVFEKRNASFFGKGLVINKYTGSRGKSGSNDANAEYLGEVRRIFEKYDVAYQSSELGKVDQGGGGTIAYIMALYGMDVVDSGVAVLSMHAPHEAVSKADVYEAKKGYVAFISE